MPDPEASTHSQGINANFPPSFPDRHERGYAEPLVWPIFVRIYTPIHMSRNTYIVRSPCPVFLQSAYLGVLKAPSLARVHAHWRYGGTHYASPLIQSAY